MTSARTIEVTQHASGFRPSPVKGYLYVAAAAFLFGMSANLGRAVFTGRLHLLGQVVPNIDPLMITQSRTTIAVLVLFPALWLARGRASLRLARRELRDCAILGTAGIAICNYTYYLAIQRTTVATAIIVQYLAPVFVLLWMLGRGLQRPTVARIGGVVVAVSGSALAIGVATSTPHFPWLAVLPGQVRFDTLGIAAALVAGVTFAFYNVFARHLIETHDRWTIQAWTLASAAIFWMLVNPPWRIMAAHYTPVQWLFMAIFSMTSILFPFSLYIAGLQHLDATRAIVTSCLEPVFSIAIAASFLGERMGPVQIVGVVLVLASTVVVQLETKPGGLPAEPIE